MLIAGLALGGGLVFWKYNAMLKGNPEALRAVLFSIKQQAGLMAALAAAVFAVLAALEKGVATSSSGAMSSAAAAIPVFGRTGA